MTRSAVHDEAAQGHHVRTRSARTSLLRWHDAETPVAASSPLGCGTPIGGSGMSADMVIKGGTVVDGTGAPGVPGRRGRHRRAHHRDRPEPRRATASSTPAATSWPPASSTSTPTTTRRSSGIRRSRRRASTASPPSSPGNCGFSIAPTRPEHRELIARTLENVEDMDVATLGRGHPVGLRDLPRVPRRRSSGAARGLNFAAYIGHTALRLFVMGDDAYERAATDDEIAADAAVLREAMDAGAAGFATSFALTHRGDRRQAGAQPLRRARRVRGARRGRAARSGRGVVAASSAGDSRGYRRHVRPAAAHRRPVHLQRAADDRRPATTETLAELNDERLGRAAPRSGRR